MPVKKTKKRKYSRKTKHSVKKRSLRKKKSIRKKKLMKKKKTKKKINKKKSMKRKSVKKRKTKKKIHGGEETWFGNLLGIHSSVYGCDNRLRDGRSENDCRDCCADCDKRSGICDPACKSSCPAYY